MNDPKYNSTEDGLFHVTGHYYVPQDEPCMIFRGKDIGALSAIVDYICMLEEQPSNAVIVSHLESSLERLKAFYIYQVENPELQSVGCSIKNHDGCLTILNSAKLMLKKYDLL